MSSTCAVTDCHNSSKKLKLLSETACVAHQQPRRTCPCPPPYALHSMPAEEERRGAWLAALKLQHPPKRVYVCSFHFVDKRPTEQHPDPELYLDNERPHSKKKQKLEGCTASTKVNASIAVNVDQPGKDRARTLNYYPVAFYTTIPDHISSDSADSLDPPLCSADTPQEVPLLQDHDYCQPVSKKDVQDKMTQCDETGFLMLQSDADALLYTGITLETFHILVSTLEGYASNSFPLSLHDQVLLTLMTLKTNSVIGDLSNQFHIPQSMGSNIVSYWIDKLDQVLRPLIPWLPRETIQATMPAAFKEKFPSTTCIVTCIESLLQKPQSLDSTRESYSHYRSHNTVKYLVAVAPCGLVMFISAAYGARCNNKFITMNSGLLDYLIPGDEVMADQGFNIKDLLSERKVRLVRPSFIKECGQLTCKSQPAHARIHVDKTLMQLKMYKILSQVVSNTMAPKIDKILQICAALVNLRCSN